MKPDIHPQYGVTEVICTCGNTFTTRSTANGMIHAETCNVCHPFYTGKQRVLDTAGGSRSSSRSTPQAASRRKKAQVAFSTAPAPSRGWAPSACPRRIRGQGVSR